MKDMKYFVMETIYKTLELISGIFINRWILINLLTIIGSNIVGMHWYILVLAVASKEM
jgi:hypothetical protein